MTEKEWDELTEQLARQVYEGTLNGVVHEATVLATTETLFTAIMDGLGQELLPIEAVVNEARYAPLKLLLKNTFHFSGAKNWNQLQEISLLLKNDKGELRPFEQFRKEVLAISKTYNSSYLQAEYQHAQATATSISKWQKIMDEKESLPWLEYTAVNDDNTRPEHAALNGTMKRVDDSFWKTYFPPNGWNCRCKVRQRAQGEPKEPASLPKLQPMFKTNVGETGVVFSDKHPYISTMPKETRKKIFVASEKVMKDAEEIKG